MKLGVTDIIQSFYQQKSEEPLGLEDLANIENNNPTASRDTIIIAKMNILSDILCTKKTKKNDQQLFLFLPPLIKLLEHASSSKGVELSEAADKIRSSK